MDDMPSETPPLPSKNQFSQLFESVVCLLNGQNGMKWVASKLKHFDNAFLVHLDEDQSITQLLDFKQKYKNRFQKGSDPRRSHGSALSLPTAPLTTRVQERRNYKAKPPLYQIIPRCEKKKRKEVDCELEGSPQKLATLQMSKSDALKTKALKKGRPKKKKIAGSHRKKRLSLNRTNYCDTPPQNFLSIEDFLRMRQPKSEIQDKDLERYEELPDEGYANEIKEELNGLIPQMDQTIFDEKDNCGVYDLVQDDPEELLELQCQNVRSRKISLKKKKYRGGQFSGGADPRRATGAPVVEFRNEKPTTRKKERRDYLKDLKGNGPRYQMVSKKIESKRSKGHPKKKGVRKTNECSTLLEKVGSIGEISNLERPKTESIPYIYGSDSPASHTDFKMDIDMMYGNVEYYTEDFG